MGKSTIHFLKIMPLYFKAVLDKSKTFEIRKNDRRFKEGEYVLLKEYDVVSESFTGREIMKRIGFVTDYEQKENYVVFSLLD